MTISALSNMIGTWDCTEVFHAGGWSETEIVTENARDVFSWGPGKKYILADYESISSFGLFEAHDVIFWDEAQQSYQFYFFNSLNGGVQLQTGRLDGNRIVFSHRDQMKGMPGLFRRTYELPSPDTQRLVVDFVPDDGRKILIATIDKKRRG